MYIALVMICMMGNPNYCQILEDQRGPYKTYERCQDRAMEMARDVSEYMPSFKPVRWKCKGVGKGQLTTTW
tara:strand:+ start:341 stop:553 length:213 start_codon:yes stop_codon:yes gene_type:complete